MKIRTTYIERVRITGEMKDRATIILYAKSRGLSIVSHYFNRGKFYLTGERVKKHEATV